MTMPIFRGSPMAGIASSGRCAGARRHLLCAQNAHCFVDFHACSFIAASIVASIFSGCSGIHSPSLAQSHTVIESPLSLSHRYRSASMRSDSTSASSCSMLARACFFTAASPHSAKPSADSAAPQVRLFHLVSFRLP